MDEDLIQSITALDYIETKLQLAKAVKGYQLTELRDYFEKTFNIKDTSHISPMRMVRCLVSPLKLRPYDCVTKIADAHLKVKVVDDLVAFALESGYNYYLAKKEDKLNETLGVFTGPYNENRLELRQLTELVIDFENIPDNKSAIKEASDKMAEECGLFSDPLSKDEPEWPEFVTYCPS